MQYIRNKMKMYTRFFVVVFEFQNCKRMDYTHLLKINLIKKNTFAIWDALIRKTKQNKRKKKLFNFTRNYDNS